MTQATILLVEDEPPILEGMSRALKKAGYDVLTATNGEAGLARLDETTPDLIVADIMMPVMDGYEFYNTLRANPRWELVPFIFATARGEVEHVREGKRMGVDDYLTKPFEIEDLLVAVEAKLRRARRIQQATQDELQTLKGRILTMFNHEFRTPLTLIKGYAEMAKMGGELDADTLLNYIVSIGHGAERLFGLIEDLLLNMEIEAGAAEQCYNLRKERLESLSCLVAAVAASFEAQAAQAGVALDAEVPPDLPLVEGDADYLGTALSRLVDNAIKFSPAGARVAINASAQNGTVVISVADQGRGIPPEEQPYIFDAFHQVNRARYEQQGAGLGLSIASGLIALHGGQIEVASDGVPGRGSTFTVTLPIAP
ncbi:MAG: hybrid sensor histidine kinase/response regulator [Anaerolineae bacterium]|nr:MAG: hybrid sensor histidine kinase/response regulator [Anaerolineae bacterium]